MKNLKKIDGRRVGIFPLPVKAVEIFIKAYPEATEYDNSIEKYIQGFGSISLGRRAYASLNDQDLIVNNSLPNGSYEKMDEMVKELREAGFSVIVNTRFFIDLM